MQAALALRHSTYVGCWDARGNRITLDAGASEMSANHVGDVAGAVMASSAISVMLAPDYAALATATIGAVIGGFLSVAIVPETTRKAMRVKWAVSTFTSICTSPFLFQNFSTPFVVDGVLHEAYLPKTAEAMLALSTAIALGAWVALRLAQLAWEQKLRRRFGLPPPEPRRRETDKDEP